MASAGDLMPGSSSLGREEVGTGMGMEFVTGRGRRCRSELRLETQRE